MIAVHVFRDAEAVARHAAEGVVAACDGSVQRHGRFLWCLAGGDTPRLAYEHLAGGALSTRVLWHTTEVFFGDERSVPPTDPASNFGMAQRALLAHVALPSTALHRIAGELEPSKAAAAYEIELRARLGVAPAGTPLRGFDLTWLGMGADGHTASLFPHSVDPPEGWVEARHDQRQSNWRITLLPQVFNASRAVHLLVTGSHKAEMVAEALTGPLRPDALPVQRVSPAGGKLIWMLDRDAAGVLLQRDPSRSPRHISVQIHS
jgi:6-phosphogluconolactonase